MALKKLLKKLNKLSLGVPSNGKAPKKRLAKVAKPKKAIKALKKSKKAFGSEGVSRSPGVKCEGSKAPEPGGAAGCPAATS